MPPLIGIFRQAPRERLGEWKWYVRDELDDGRWIIFEDRADQLCLIRGWKRGSSRDHLVGDRAERKDVRPDVRLSSFELLGRDVLERAQDRALGREPLESVVRGVVKGDAGGRR